MTETQHYKLKKPEGSDYAKIETLNENTEQIDAVLYLLATGDIDCGLFEDADPVAVHSASAAAHPAMLVDGNAAGVSAAETLEEHMEDPLAHPNINLDGNVN